jgi:hypothetical protein
MMRPLTLSVLATFLWWPHLEAITVVAMSFEELTAEATTVVCARVADVRGQWTSDRRSIDSIITLDALRYFKGDLGPSPMMRLPGGSTGNVINVIPGAPVLRDGEIVVVFLTSRGPAIPTALGLGQGIFQVLRDARSGALVVSPPPLKASAGGKVLRGGAERQLLTLDAFGEAVRALPPRHAHPAWRGPRLPPHHAHPAWRGPRLEAAR